MPLERILLHACCGPCSLEPVRILRSEGAEPVVFYANSNIHPADEYARRLATLRAWAAGEGLEVVEGTYDAEEWEAVVGRVGDAAEAKFGVIVNEEGDAEAAPHAGANSASRPNLAGDGFSRPSPSEATPLGRDGASPAPAEGATEARAAREARCRACYRLRFEEAARYAREHGFTAVGTTLSVSPYQYTRIIREELERACEREGVEARFADYRPYYDEATRRSREGGMYRQNYCGCRFSDAEAAAERDQRRAARRAAREAELAAHAHERAAEEAKRARNRAEKQAYAEAQAKKRAILKALRAQQ
ncbi:epoxyqueuosine reductase QueH [Adlercreutzia sp. R25]|uniref:Epoxyqueuosine reductase QueH n=1 Tax=Adlercreutzia shanghongiae TaxID=3111773 RepID=A0ABU6IY98_9ACTN|nr:MULTISPECIES: epoxyqueuosine reductase QueH [unclassified Adlercreutzia]MEC4271787.1 epoxyqueuosine reductase QueH [Adlercreutzia sp. R25]MEC4294794.1 epoxyqueuosine reductase QueH [Adlercreutzia sp. R22]